MRYLVERHRKEMEAAKTAPRKTVSLEELRGLLGYTGTGLDHAKMAQTMGAAIKVGDTMYSVTKD